ncbi:hypothetical protein ACFPMF_12750 [Larkinella bovis]|uniref:Uncharacterized protein n=1 Tax=Larkinella bovis TaxID=683041 RepID=A0ABW0I9H3_9BACT
MMEARLKPFASRGKWNGFFSQGNTGNSKKVISALLKGGFVEAGTNQAINGNGDVGTTHYLAGTAAACWSAAQSRFGRDKKFVR